MQISTISSITLSKFWEGTRVHEVAFRQGELDGACGPYAMTMALLLMNGLSVSKAKELWNIKGDGRKMFARWMAGYDAMFQKGTNDEDLKRLFKAIQSEIDTATIRDLVMSDLSRDPASNNSRNALQMVREHLDEFDKPALLVLNWSKTTSHWVVAVGYQMRQKNGKEDLANILTLDPGSFISKTGAWNGVLGLGAIGDRKLRYMTNEDEPQICSLSQAIGFSPKSQRKL